MKPLLVMSVATQQLFSKRVDNLLYVSIVLIKTTNGTEVQNNISSNYNQVSSAVYSRVSKRVFQESDTN